MQLEVKHGTVQFVARKIIITTPRDPRNTWVGRADEDLQQLLRRIEHIELIGEEVPPIPDPQPYVENFVRHRFHY